MSNCVSCGRELPGFPVGTGSDLCADCRAAALARQMSSSTESPSSRLVAVRSGAPVTTALVGINLAVFGAMVLAGVSPLSPTAQQLLRWGADFGPLSLRAEPWRILTSNYLHVGIIHVFFDMWCLWNLGFLAERVLDRWTHVLTYSACGLAGSLASLWWHPLVIGAGASGAIFGLAGALIAVLYLGHLPIPRAALRGTLKSLLAFAGYNLFFGAVGAGIDNSAHIGGLFTGLALGAAMSKHLTVGEELRARWRWYVFVVTAIILLLAYGYIKQHGGITPEPRGH
jgi:membrane associated rhomboid family serine protease